MKKQILHAKVEAKSSMELTKAMHPTLHHKSTYTPHLDAPQSEKFCLYEWLHTLLEITSRSGTLASGLGKLLVSSGCKTRTCWFRSRGKLIPN